MTKKRKKEPVMCGYPQWLLPIFAPPVTGPIVTHVYWDTAEYIQHNKKKKHNLEVPKL